MHDIRNVHGSVFSVRHTNIQIDVQPQLLYLHIGACTGLPNYSHWICVVYPENGTGSGNEI